MALEITPEQVSFVIAMARELGDALPTDLEDDESHRGEAVDPELVKEHAYSAAYQEITGFFKTLSDDELAELTAIMWIGRGTFEPDEFSAALEEAQNIGVRRIPGYLLSTALLAEYLTEGLNALGLEVEET